MMRSNDAMMTICYSLVLVTSLLQTSSCFVGRCVVSFGHRQRRKNHLGLLARVFNPPWEESTSAWEDSNESSNSYMGFADSSSTLASDISYDKKDALARLAAAFPPQGQPVHLEDINNVQVLGYDDNHIDIEAVVCKEESCLTLMVPVAFPHPCDGSEARSDCVIHNLDELDAQAETQLKQLDLSSNQEEQWLEAWKDFVSFDHGVDFPSWWVPSGSLDQDCQNFQRVLNQESYQNEIKALVYHALSFTEDVTDLHVDGGTVIDICPAGIFLRAKVRKGNLLSEEQFKVVEVPLLFCNGPASDASNLKTAVLEMISSAMQHVEKMR